MKIFITGTDTDVGKTVVSAWLCTHLQADYWKPIQTGYPQDCDSTTVQHLAGLDACYVHMPVYRLSAPVSPHLAAVWNQQSIDLARITMPITKRSLIVEGAGGILTPLNDTQTMLDLMVQLQLPVIVVARSTLGTINHTCLTLRLLRQYHLDVLGVILCGPLNADNKQAIEHYGQTTVLAELPRLSELTPDNLQYISLPVTFRKFIDARISAC